METLRPFALHLTPELMLLQQGRDAKKGALSPGAMRIYQEVAEQARALSRPGRWLSRWHCSTCLTCKGSNPTASY